MSDEPGKSKLKESETAAIRGGAAVRSWVPGPAADTDLSNKNNHDTNRNINSAGTQKEGPRQVEAGGRNGPDPTRFGDWEIKGRCIDF